MNNVIGLVNVTKEMHGLQALTTNHCHASLPYGGRYSTIDFVLSSMVHSKIRNVAIFMSSKSHALVEHLGSGKDWDLEYKRDGLVIFPNDPAISTNDSGDLSTFLQHLDYLERSPEEYVLITFGSLIMNIDFKPIIKQHMKTDADVTVVYKEKKPYDNAYANVTLDNFQNVTDINDLESPFGSLDIFVMKKDKFIQLIKNYANQRRPFLDIVNHCEFTRNIKGYKYDGFVQKIDSIQHYYQSNMDLLDPRFLKLLVSNPNEIYTKLIDEPPSTYTETSSVQNSIIANGCVIEGKVENCVLFSGVHVRKDAIIRNSIVMQACDIGERAALDGVIVDQEVAILPFEQVKGTATNPKIVTKQKVIGSHLV